MENTKKVVSAKGFTEALQSGKIFLTPAGKEMITKMWVSGELSVPAANPKKAI